MLRYHSVQPENTKSSYSEYDAVDFVLTFENRALNPNSIRLEADLIVKNDGNDVAASDAAYIDCQAGAHCFFHSVQTEFQSTGVVENLQEYPRYVKMVADATMTPDDTLNSENTCELRSPDQKLSQVMLQGIPLMDGATNTAGNPVVVNPDFSIKPKFCLNTLNTALPYAKSGAVRVSVKLSRNAAALYGDSTAGSPLTYTLSNLRIVFVSIPVPAKTPKISMRTKLNIKQAITSSFANISTKVPAVCNAVSCSFQQQSKENALSSNNLRTEVLPNVTELQFLFNDSQDQYITYQIKDREELLLRYIQSFADSGSNGVSLDKLKANDSFGIGLNFRDFIDLSNQKFNVQLVSGMQSNNPYILYMYFHSVVSM